MISYNDGFSAMADVFKQLGIEPGHYFYVGAFKKDSGQVKNMNRKSLDTVKKPRKKLRLIRKGFIDTERVAEGGDSYSSGTFSGCYSCFFLLNF